MATRPRYDEFEIEVRSISRDVYETRVLGSEFGRAKSPFTVPIGQDERGDVLSALQSRVLASSPRGRDLVRVRAKSKAESGRVEEDLGHRLFASLFAGEVRERFREAMTRARERDPAGRHELRLRLTFDKEEDFAVLATLPWEFLRDGRSFIGQNRRVAVVRSLNVPRVPMPLPARAPLKVLLVNSSPRDLDPLETAEERRKIEEALRAQPAIRVEHLEHPKLQDLRDLLIDGEFQIIHFMGHGGFVDTGRDEFVLYFESEDGLAEPVTGMQLAEFLYDIPTLRLVVLNSCWSGAFPRRRGQDPFTGVAAALMAREIPAVVAMQFPISDWAAICFSTRLYQRLVMGDPLCAAVAEGRLAIFGGKTRSLEWATPVLFLAGDGELFDFSKSRAARSGGAGETARSKRTPREEPPLQLSIWSVPDPFISIEKPDDLLDLRPYFDGRKIREHRLWQEEVFPQLREFLLQHKRPGRPIVLDFAAHSTLAFAAGYCLEAKSGLDVKIYQRGRLGTRLWHAEAGPPRQGALWRKEKEIRAARKAHDVAMAVGVTHDVLKDVKVYLRSSGTRVGRVLPLTVSPGPGDTAVADGLHALQLAQDLAYRIRLRTPEERSGTLHLFTAAPNVLLFFLGQLGRAFGSTQLYEHLFGAEEPGAYLPSLRLPLPQDLPRSSS